MHENIKINVENRIDAFVYFSGTYSNATNLKNETECSPCPGGYYCETDGLTAPTGLCGEGYYCEVGTIYKEPALKFCPVGHYCPEGVSQPVPCRNYSEVGYCIHLWIRQVLFFGLLKSETDSPSLELAHSLIFLQISLWMSN